MEPIDSWIIANAEALHLQLKEYTWPKKWWPGIYDLSATILIDGQEFIGRGTDYNSNTTTRKAIVEALERFVSKSNGCASSNGIAAHIDRKNAILAAKYELIERDLFLMHFLSMRSFSNLDSKCLMNFPKFLQENLSKQNVNIYYRTLVDQENTKGVIAIATGFKCKKPWGLCFGMSVDTDFKRATEKAAIECLRHVIPLLQEDEVPTPHTLASFKNTKSITVEDHFRLGLNIDYAQWFFEHFLENPTEHPRSIGREPCFEFSDLTFSASVSKPPLHVAMCKSKDLQDLFFGNTLIEKINLDRLFDFEPTLKQNLSSVNLMPHPIC